MQQVWEHLSPQWIFDVTSGKRNQDAIIKEELIKLCRNLIGKKLVGLNR